MVITNQQVPQIGTGLYTPQEASTFAKLRLNTFNRWLYESGHGDAVIAPRIPQIENERVITFWDLIQAVAIRNLRFCPTTAKIPLQKIREAVDSCQEQGFTFPLARDHNLYWFSNRLVLKVNDDTYKGIKPRVDKDQLYSGPIIEPFLKDVKFGADKLATVWTPLTRGSYRVDLNAEKRFGMPIIEPGGVLVDALVNAVEAEGSIEAAADAFEVDAEAVLLALKYREYLASAA